MIPSHSIAVPTREQLLAADLPFEVRSVNDRKRPVIRRYASAEHAATHLVVETLVLRDRPIR